MNPQDIHQFIRDRKSVFPRNFIDKEIENSVITELLKTANWAPSHKLTEPWRFKVFQGDALEGLGDFLSASYQEMIGPENYSEVKADKLRNNPPKAGAVIAICIQRDPEARIPEWEELAAVSCAVQNLWLAAGAHGLGGYWSTPEVISMMGNHIDLNEGETCIGLFYLGHFEEFPTNRKRKSINDKTTWYA